MTVNSPDHKLPLILLADDDEIIQDLIGAFLEQNGYDSILVENGQEAVDAFTNRKPDLALLDANMPVLDGFEACKHIRSLPDGRRLPIVMVTALSDDASVDKAFEAGAEDYVTKPIHWAVLRQRIRILLDRKQAEERIHYQATHDALTGLPNRTLFMDRIDSAISMGSRRNIQMGLMFIDLDRFKWVNDELGHAAGDQLLQEAAERMKRCVRKSDTVARLGGDEFTVILSDISGTLKPDKVAEKLLQTLREPFTLEGQEVTISGSIGGAIYPHDGTDTETLLRNADHAMYVAKNKGRNCCWFYTPTMNRQEESSEDTES
jgi:diguanylate cyclase (GGDEF)-like protein